MPQRYQARSGYLESISRHYFLLEHSWVVGCFSCQEDCPSGQGILGSPVVEWLQEGALPSPTFFFLNWDHISLHLCVCFSTFPLSSRVHHCIMPITLHLFFFYCLLKSSPLPRPDLSSFNGWFYLFSYRSDIIQYLAFSV